jgi:hypothetical protein
MPEFKVAMPVDQLCALLRQEAEGNYVNFHVNGRKQYIVDQREDGPGHRPHRTAVMRGVLNVEPLAEQNYWVLRLEATRELGPANPGDESSAPEADLSVDDFAEEFIADDTRTSARLIAQTEAGPAAFGDWLRTAALGTVDSMPVTLRIDGRQG